jgi:hypothetical protein
MPAKRTTSVNAKKTGPKPKSCIRCIQLKMFCTKTTTCDRYVRQPCREVLFVIKKLCTLITGATLTACRASIRQAWSPGAACVPRETES